MEILQIFVGSLRWESNSFIQSEVLPEIANGSKLVLAICSFTLYFLKPAYLERYLVFYSFEFVPSLFWLLAGFHFVDYILSNRNFVVITVKHENETFCGLKTTGSVVFKVFWGEMGAVVHPVDTQTIAFDFA